MMIVFRVEAEKPILYIASLLLNKTNLAMSEHYRYRVGTEN